jgi:hypothetical protein
MSTGTKKNNGSGSFRLFRWSYFFYGHYLARLWPELVRLWLFGKDVAEAVSSMAV